MPHEAHDVIRVEAVDVCPIPAVVPDIDLKAEGRILILPRSKVGIGANVLLVQYAEEHLARLQPGPVRLSFRIPYLV
jgi:hypothetical protein